jgi:clan AA aspartic protease (TIGR02281 family)
VLKTERRGTQHSVGTSLEGAGGKRIGRTLLIDTGADYVVLPESLKSQLGVAEDKLKEREMQTANGRAKASVGVLPALWLGEQRIPDVEVAFIDDGKLGDGGLLGMSVLSRYTMTIDDEEGRLTLSAKGSSGEETKTESSDAQPTNDKGGETPGEDDNPDQTP